MHTVEELRTMTPEQRLQYAQQLIDNNCICGEDSALACLFVAVDQRRSGALRGAAMWAERGLSSPCERMTAFRLRTIGGLACVDMGDLDHAERLLGSLAETDAPSGLAGEWYGAKARLVAGRMDAGAFALFGHASSFFSKAGRVQNAAAMQVDAAILAIGLQDFEIATDWLKQITYEPFIPAREILQAQILLEKGDVVAAGVEAERILAVYKDRLDDNDHGRVLFILSQFEWQQGRIDMARSLMEKAARLAHTATPLDMDLVRRIQRVREVA